MISFTSPVARLTAPRRAADREKSLKAVKGSKGQSPNKSGKNGNVVGNGAERQMDELVPKEMMPSEPVFFPEWLRADRGPARTDPQLGAQKAQSPKLKTLSPFKNAQEMVIMMEAQRGLEDLRWHTGNQLPPEIEELLGKYLQDGKLALAFDLKTGKPKVLPAKEAVDARTGYFRKGKPSSVVPKDVPEDESNPMMTTFQSAVELIKPAEAPLEVGKSYHAKAKGPLYRCLDHVRSASGTGLNVQPGTLGVLVAKSIMAIDTGEMFGFSLFRISVKEWERVGKNFKGTPADLRALNQKAMEIPDMMKQTALIKLLRNLSKITYLEGDKDRLVAVFIDDVYQKSDVYKMPNTIYIRPKPGQMFEIVTTTEGRVGRVAANKAQLPKMVVAAAKLIEMVKPRKKHRKRPGEEPLRGLLPPWHGMGLQMIQYVK